MKYTRENYEEFALDYVENTLSPNDRKEFETFLLLNPDIQEELNEFKWIEVTPDLDVRFPDLNKLKRTSTPQAKIISSKFLLRAAAAILLLLVMSVVFINRDPHSDLVVGEDVQEDKVNSSPGVLEESLPSDDLLAAQSEDTDLLKANSEKKVEKSNPASQDEDRMADEVEVVEQIAAIDLTDKKHLLDPKDAAVISVDKLNEEMIKNHDDSFVSMPRIADAKFSPLVFDRSIDEKYLPGIQPYLEEEGEKSKIARFFARANFIPSTLIDLDKDELKEKFIPESFYSR